MATLTIRTTTNLSGTRDVEVHNATSIRYAAKHAAEAYGRDPDLPWSLYHTDGTLINPDDVAVDYDGRTLLLRR